MNNEQLRNPIEEIAEEFIQRRRNGERPSVEELARDYPELADQIRELFPALELMEHARDDVVETANDSGRLVEVGQRLGDFHILREIGRGGMGVVYEAHQSSLGRRVALKILSPSLQENGKYLERFRREARAAANLQHANIVPVYGVAHVPGFHFYVMQLIYGCGLDEVFDALCHGGIGSAIGDDESDEHSVSADGLAVALATGQFRAQALRIDPSLQPQPAAVAGVVDYEPENASHQCIQADVETAKIERSTTHSSSNQHNGKYIRRIAGIGSLAADALAHAHQNGVLHRDIKPGNLLLDIFGNIWISDFGLVKISGEEGLTETGDIVGTLRYLAPECLRGEFDARSDIYGLGLTLHEMISREKAFSAVSRGELTKQIAERGPAPLNDVPLDLVTIIRKATALEPNDRYQTAAEFADDLNRFLASQPIRARRASATERIWRWSKRNRMLAAALATSLVLLIGGMLGSLAFSWQLNMLATERQTALVAAEDESRDAKRRLVDASISRAEALAASQLPGQRIEGLEAITEAVRIARELELGSDTIGRLRNAAISSLANADVLPIKEWDNGVGTLSDAAFDKRLETYAIQPVNFGPIEIRRVSDQTIISRIQGQNYWGWKWMSPDGRFLAATTHISAVNRLHVYDTQTAELVNDLGVPIEGFAQYAHFQFNETGEQAAIATSDNFVRVYTIGNNTPVFEIEVAADCFVFGGPDRLVVCRRKPVAPSIVNSFALRVDDESLQTRIRKLIRRLIDFRTEEVAECYTISTGKLNQTIKLSGPASSAAYGPNEMLAVVCSVGSFRRDKFSAKEENPQKTIDIFELPARLPILQLRNHIQATQFISFNESGRALIVGFPDSVAIFDVRTGTQLIRAPGALKSNAGDRIAYERLGKFGIQQLVLSDVYRGLAAKKTSQPVQVDPQGQFFVTPDEDGLRFFDLETGTLLGHAKNHYCRGACFSPDGKSLFAVDLKAPNRHQLFRWPINRDRDTIRIGPPERIQIAPDFQPHHLAIDPTGSILASEDRSNYRIGIRFLKENREPVLIDGPNTLMFIALSNDLRWAATGTWHGNEAAIYDLDEKQAVRTVSTGKSNVTFTQDSKSLICASGRVVELDTWNERQMDTNGEPVHFLGGFMQPANRTFAYVSLRNPFGKLAVIDTTNWSTLATIQTSNRGAAVIAGMSRDGHRLILNEFGDDVESLGLLDISGLRQQLKLMGLDWDAADFTPLQQLDRKPELLLIQ